MRLDPGRALNKVGMAEVELTQINLHHSKGASAVLARRIAGVHISP